MFPSAPHANRRLPASIRAAWLAPLLLAAACLSACDKQPEHSPQVPRRSAQAEAAAIEAPAPSAAASPSASTPWFTASPQQGPGVHLAYTHQIGLELPASSVPPHFAAARDRCLDTQALHCILLRASLAEQPGGGGGRPSAELQIRLPHDQVTPFAQSLTAPLPGENAGAVHVVRQSTQAVDLGQPVADIAQRVAQLTDYLASLKSMGGRLTISVGDLVKIASETAQAQSQIEEAQSQQRNLALRVDTEALTIDFEPETMVVSQDPVAQTLAQANTLFRSSMAGALQVGIQAVPWIPVALAGLLLAALMRAVIFPRRRLPPRG